MDCPAPVFRVTDDLSTDADDPSTDVNEVSIDDMKRTMEEFQKIIAMRWEMVNFQAKQNAVTLMGEAATNPAARTYDMRAFVASSIPKANCTLSDHLKDFGFQVCNRGKLSKLVYRRDDGRVFNDIIIRDKHSTSCFCVDNLETDVFNHLYVKFYMKRRNAINKAKETKLSNTRKRIQHAREMEEMNVKRLRFE